MRYYPLIFTTGLLAAVSAAPQTNPTEEISQRAAEKRFVNVWGDHEYEIADVKGKGWRVDPTEPTAEIPSWRDWRKKGKTKSSTSSSSPSVTLPVETKPTEETDAKMSILPIVDEDGKIVVDKPDTLPSPTPLTTTTTDTSTTSSSTPSTPTSKPSFSLVPVAQPTELVSSNGVKLPPYPDGLTDPVDPASFLEKFIPDVKAYWNRTRVIFPACNHFKTDNKGKYSQRQPCVPNCEDVYSHTREAIIIDCNRVELCTYATYVLPDSQCPGRVNSYKKRCPQSFEEINTKKIRSSGNTAGQDVTKEIVDAMKAGTHITPAQCRAKAEKEKADKAKTTTTTPANARRSSVAEAAEPVRVRSSSNPLAVRNPNTAGGFLDARSLQKRGYTYRSYLDNLNYYRSWVLTGPPMENCYINPNGTPTVCPFVCSEIEATVFIEFIETSVGRYELCTFPSDTRMEPEERCPGIGNPQENCPSDEESLLNQLTKQSSKTREEWIAILKKETEQNKCDETNTNEFGCKKPLFERRRRRNFTA